MNDTIDIAWPLWGWIISPVDLLAVGLLAFSQDHAFYMGYDLESDRWHEVARFHHLNFFDPNYLWEASEALETWLHDRFEWEELTRL